MAPSAAAAWIAQGAREIDDEFVHFEHPDDRWRAKCDLAFRVLRVVLSDRKMSEGARTEAYSLESALREDDTP